MHKDAVHLRASNLIQRVAEAALRHRRDRLLALNNNVQPGTMLRPQHTISCGTYLGSELVNDDLQLCGNDADAIEAGIDGILRQQGWHNLLMPLSIILHAMHPLTQCAVPL